MKRSTWILGAIFLALSLVMEARERKEADGLFEEGINAFQEGNLKMAIERFEEIAQFSHSVNLYGNLGNLYHQITRYDKAVLNYRRALIMKASSEDREAIEASLQSVRKDAQLDTQDIESGFSYQHADIWTWASAAFFWLGLFSLVYLIRSKLSTLTKGSLAASWFALLVGGVVASCKSHQNLKLLEREAVIVAPANEQGKESVEFLNLSGKVLFTIRPGSIIRIDLDDKGAFKKRRIGEQKASSPATQATTQECYFAHSLADDRKGWVRKENLEWIWVSNRFDR